MSESPRRIEYVALNEVQRATRNPRTHDTLDGVKASIRRFGFVDGAVHDGRTGRIIAGHGRLEALEAMFVDGEKPPEGIVVRDDGAWMMPLQVGWSSGTDEEAESLLVWLNKSVEDGGWDEQELADLLVSLRASDKDLFDLSGFENGELDKLLYELSKDAPAAREGDPDDVPDLFATVKSNVGDVWVLGDHRLVVGDSGDPTVLMEVMDGDRADCVWTDPPYGVSYQTDMTLEEAERLNRRKDGLEVANDKLIGADLKGFLRGSLGAAKDACRPGACWYVCSPSGEQLGEFADVLHELGVWRQMLVWVKDVFVFGRSDYHYRHEMIFYGWKEGAAHHAVPTRDQDSVWEIARPKKSPEHPTMKPVELVTRALRNSTNPGDVVLDPFGGSGTTLIAAEMLGRKARVVELDRRYADVICRRFQNLTGVLPVLKATGEAHDFAVIDQADVLPKGMGEG